LLKNAPKDIGFDIVSGYKILEGQNVPTKFKIIGYTEGITGIKGKSPRVVSTKPINIRSGFSSILAETEIGGTKNQLVSYSDIHTLPKNILPDFKMVKSGFSGRGGMSSITGNAVSELKFQNIPESQTPVITRTVQTSAKQELKGISLNEPVSKIIPLTLTITKQVPVVKTKPIIKTRTSTFTTQKPTTITGIKSDMFPIQKTFPISKVSPIEKTIQINKVMSMQKQVPIQKQVPVQKHIARQNNMFTAVSPIPIGFTPPPPPGQFGFSVPHFSGFTRYGKSYISSRFTPRYTANLEANIFGVKRTRTPKSFTGLELRGL
jgi:hypothetical protein